MIQQIHYLLFHIPHSIIHDFKIRTGFEFFLRHHGIYPLLRLLLRDMITPHDAFDTHWDGSCDTDHEIEVGAMVETAIKEDALSNQLQSLFSKSRATAGCTTSFTACLFASPVRIN